MATKDITDSQVVEAFTARDGDAISRLAATTGQPLKVCFRAAERALRRGLIECGVSLRTGWVTDAGRVLRG